MLLSDPENKLKDAGAMVCWVLQMEEDVAAHLCKERVVSAVNDFHTTKKGRKLPVKTMGEAMQGVPAKHLKEKGVWVKTKDPVYAIVTDNTLSCVTDAKE